MTKTELQTAQKKSWKMTVCANHTNYFSTASRLQRKLKLQPPVHIPLWNQGCIHPMSHAVITTSFVTKVLENETLLHWNGTLRKELSERLFKELICSDNGSWLYPCVLPLYFYLLLLLSPFPSILPVLPLSQCYLRHPSTSHWEMFHQKVSSLSSFSLVKVKANVAGVRSDQPS